MRSFFISLCTLITISSSALSTQIDSLQFENLVFEGAGIRGIAYCGALMELDERGMLGCVKRIGGTSSGAITGCLVSIGYSPSETYAIIGETDFGKFNDGRWGIFGGVSRLRKRFGYYRGQEFLKWLEKLIEAKTGSKNTTFRDLKQLRDNGATCQYKDLYIAATSLNHQKTVIFSAESFPDMRIADAVHASMAIPLYFEPVIVAPNGQVKKHSEMKDEDHLCVDGGFTANFIIQHFDTFDQNGQRILAPTIGLRLDATEQIKNDKGDKQLAYQHIEDTGDFIGAFFYFLKETTNRQLLSEDDWKRTVSISDCGMSPKVKKLSSKEKEMLIRAGRLGVNQFLAS